jgi:hypothetical protein
VGLSGPERIGTQLLCSYGRVDEVSIGAVLFAWANCVVSEC